MSFSAHSLFSQKKGTIYSLVLLIAVLAVIVGILSVSGAKFSTSPGQQFTPRWVLGGAANATLNITITNDATSPVAIQRVDIAKPSGISIIDCGPTATPSWDCSKVSTTVSFQNAGGLAAGSSINFTINITPPAGAGNYSLLVTTYENTGGTAAQNTTSGITTTGNANVSVDAHPPSIKLMNISTSVKNISTDANFDSLVHIFLNNASAGITVVVEVLDNGSEVGNVTLAYNYTADINQVPVQVPGRNTGNTTVNMTNQSFGSSSLFGYTIPTSTFTNGTKVFFSILVNDTVGNYNISNKTSTVGYNFTIDAAAPRFEDVQIANNSQLTTNTAGNAINTTKTFGSTVEHILNSSLLLNVSALVSDGGGSGVVKVEIMNRSGAFTVVQSLILGTNGSASQTVWNYSVYNITDLAQRVGGFNGDGVYNLSFKVTDNVSNVVNSNFTVEVDDNAPTGVVLGTNLTVDGKLSEGNASTLNFISNGSFVIRLQTSNNINNITRNVSVFGNKGFVYNMTYESGTPSGTATWNLTIKNETSSNITNFCDIGAADGSQCNFRFNFSDVLGRYNDTLNLTVVVDNLNTNVSIVRPVSITTNHTTTVLINASVNDSVGPLRNVSFRWVNFSSGVYLAYLEGANMSNWMPLTLSSGGNSQFNAQGYWTATLTISSLVDGNYSIEINATDSAGRQNTTTNVTNLVFDSTPPTNISFFNPRTSNTFQKAMFNITMNVTDRISGLRNVSFRLENSSFNWPWVEGSQVVTALTVDQRFNASNWNFTHWGGERTNATNGNFTIRLNVTDTAGNQNTSIAFNMTIDTVLPSVSFINPLNNLNQTGNFTINATVTESNVDTVQYRWVNDSNDAVNGRGPWVTMTAGTATTFNGTFTNLTVTPALFDGNYSIELNVTDKAGNQNASVYIQLILDKNQPRIVATGALDKTNQTGNFVVNLTINDTYSWNMNLGKIQTTNINGSAFRLENATFNSSWVSMAFATGDMTSADSNRTNATFTFSSVANGLYNIRFMVNDTAGNQNNSVRINDVMLDNVAPGVSFSATNVSPSPSGGAGLSGTITFNASVTDNLPLNISITNDTSVQGNKFGVFYRFESASVTTAWLPLFASNPAGFPLTTQPHNVVFNGSNITTTLADGDYKIRINATDSAGNQNTSVYVDVTIQNSASNVKARNLTFQGGFITGTSDTNQTSPVFLMNTTTNATCKYSLDTPVTYYSDMVNTMSNNVSRQHNINFGFRPDRTANGYQMYYACQDVSGNFTASEGAASYTTFSVDTRNRFNVTLGAAGTNKVRGDYFAVGWNSFNLPKTTLLGITALPTNYNITNVLSSLGNPTLTTANFTTIYSYNGSAWASYVVNAVANSFTNFTADTPTATYYINITTSNERLEIN